jgi:hypothetical protein
MPNFSNSFPPGSILSTLAISSEWLSNFSLKLSHKTGKREQCILVTLILVLAAAINITKFMEFEKITEVSLHAKEV